MDYTIKQNGRNLNTSLYTIDDRKKTFQSLEDNLELDFTSLSGWSFDILGCAWCSLSGGDSCTVIAGNVNNFYFGDNCDFDSGDRCTFITGNYCTFKTHGRLSRFNTGEKCTFNCPGKDNDFTKIGRDGTIYKYR